MSEIFTIIVYSLTSVICFGFIISIILFNVKKLGSELVSDSNTADTLVFAP